MPSLREGEVSAGSGGYRWRVAEGEVWANSGGH